MLSNSNACNVVGGEEAIPISVVNPIDEVLPPGYQRAGLLDREGWEESLPFQYTTAMMYSDSATINYSVEPRYRNHETALFWHKTQSKEYRKIGILFSFALSIGLL